MSKPEQIKTFQDMYKFLVEKGITIVEKECYDSQSGWTGKHMYLKDKNGFLWSDKGNHGYSEKPRWGTLDLSGNGYCFRERDMEGYFQEIVAFYDYMEMSSFEQFTKQLEKLKEKK